MQEVIQSVQIFALIIARVGAFMYQMPVLGARYVPNITKIGLAAGISFAIYPIVAHVDVPSSGPFMEDFVLFVLKEMLVGITVGLVVAIFISGIRFTGRTIGMNMGLSMANIVDPETGMDVSIVEEIIYLLFIFIFLVLNGHYFLIRAMVDSYSMVPLGGYSFHRDIILNMFSMLNQMLIIGFTASMPVFGVLMINNVLLGIIAKVAQKIQII
ncbi:MAG: flagellar biosynthetic protein FliR, partial [Candidatus Muiribacteriota bacterium]